MYQPVAMVDQDGKQIISSPTTSSSDNVPSVLQSVPNGTQSGIQVQPTVMTNKQLLNEIEEFNQESLNQGKLGGRSKRPRTSDDDFNKDKTNLIVNYLPQVTLLCFNFLIL